MSLPIERKLPIILSFVFLMLAAIGFLLDRRTVSFEESRENEKRSQAVIANLDDVVTYTADIETATSGFVAVGNDTYLEPSNQAKSGLKKNIAELRSLAANDALRLSEVDGLESLITQKIQFEDNKADQRRQKGYDNASYLLGMRGGIEITQQIRDAVDKLKNT